MRYLFVLQSSPINQGVVCPQSHGVRSAFGFYGDFRRHNTQFYQSNSFDIPVISMLDDEHESTMNKPTLSDRHIAFVHEQRLRIAGVVWMCAVQFFVAQAVAQSRWTTPFSLATNYISDLGNTTCGVYTGTGAFVCSPWHAVMNVSFVLQGVIIALGTVLARPAFAHGCTSNWVSVLLGITALCMVGVGLFPEDVNYRMHVISAGTQFITGNTAMLVFGIAARHGRHWRLFSSFSICFGVLGLAATGLFAQGYGLGLGVGGMERVAAYTLPLWLIAAGALMAKQRVGLMPLH